MLGRDVLGEHLAGFLAGEKNLDLRWLQRHETAHIGLATEFPEWVAALRAAGTTVFGGVGWDASHEWSPVVLDRLADVDVFVPNEVEATSYTRTEGAAATAKVLAEQVGTVIVTRGGQGSYAIDASSGQVVEEPAVAVTAVDPTGAGDVFAAGLMTGTILGWDLATRVRFAGLVASMSVRSLGGATSAPRPADVMQFLGGGARVGVDEQDRQRQRGRGVHRFRDQRSGQSGPGRYQEPAGGVSHGFQPTTGTRGGDIAASWDGVSQNGGLVPYLDYATPMFYDTLSGAVQQLTGGQQAPEEFTQTLQADYESFQQGR
ncbi:MAG: PfkB family carbohydrate kinase [Janthinobacterium lividum]